MGEAYPFSIIPPEGRVIGHVAHDVAETAPGVISDIGRAVCALDRIAISETDGPDVTVVTSQRSDRYPSGIVGITFHQPEKLLNSDQLRNVRGIGPKSLQVLKEFASAATQATVSDDPNA